MKVGNISVHFEIRLPYFMKVVVLVLWLFSLSIVHCSNNFSNKIDNRSSTHTLPPRILTLSTFNFYSRQQVSRDLFLTASQEQ